MKELTPDVVNDLIRYYRDRAIEKAQRPVNPFDDNQNWEDATRRFNETNDLISYLQMLHDYKESTRYCAVAGEYDDALEGAENLCKANDVRFNKNSAEFCSLCRGLLFANVEAAEVEMDVLQGNYDNLPGFTSKPAPPTLVVTNEKPSVTLGTVLDEYWKRREGGWGAGALESYARYKKRLLIHFGADKPIDAISYKDMEQFRDKLKMTGNRGKSISIKTVNLHLDFYGAVFNHAIQSGRITHNPVSGVKLADKRNKQTLNDPWEPEDLEKLFHSEEYKEDRFEFGWQFWLPPLLLYTGARLEELCQLYLDEIKVVDGVWVFDIDQTRPDQSVKTYEKRYIPLHPFITDELDFVSYTRSLPDQRGRLFPELKPIGLRQRYGHYPSSHWFPKYKKKCGVVSPPRKKTFHSLRHTAGYCLMEKDVQEYVIALFLGHEHPQISTSQYGKKFEPGMLMEKAVLKLDYPMDLRHLKKSKFVPR